MGTHLELQDHDDVFKKLTTTPIIVNHLLDTVEDEKKKFDNDFFVTYTDTDLLDIIPKCNCGALTGRHHIHNGKGTVCTECGFEVKQMLDRPLEPIIWVDAPEKVHRMINPQAWRLLSNFFTLSNNSNQRLNIIKYLTQTDFRPNREHHARTINMIESMGIKRGLNYFYNNFDNIIASLVTMPSFSSNKEKKEKLKDMLTFIDMYRDRLFSEKIPIHNKTILVIENTRYGTYMDTTLKTIIDAVRNICGVDSPIKDFTLAQKENHASKLSESISNFGEDHEKNFLSGKPGHIRKHVYATRCWFSLRAVIYSISRPHHHDECILPWAIMITTFRLHLLGKLYRRGYGHNDGAAFLNEYTHQHHPLLEDLLNELIQESPYTLSDTVEYSIIDGQKTLIDIPHDGDGIHYEKDGLNPALRRTPGRRGIPFMIGRNPSMYRTSIQRMFITGFTIDTKVFSIGYPITSVTGPNA